MEASAKKTFRPGEVLFKENDRSRQMYILHSGKVKVFRSEGGARIDICELSKGAIVGEMSLLDSRPRSATVEVVEESEMSVIQPEAVEKKIKGVPEWFYAIMKVLCSRLREADRRLKKSMAEDDSANVASLLAVLIDKSKKEKAAEENTFDLKFAKQEIIEILSLSHQKAVSALAELEGRNLIKTANNQLSIRDRRELDFYSSVRRGTTDIDEGLQVEAPLSGEALQLLKLLYYTAKEKTPDAQGECELSFEELGEFANKLFSGGDFVKELASLSLVGLNEENLMKNPGSEANRLIKVNPRQIASLLASALFHGETH